MESMVGKADTHPFHKGASKEMACNVAKHLATFYAYFLSHPKDKWQGKYEKNSMIDMMKDEFFCYFEQICDMKPGVFDKAFEVFKNFSCSKPFFTYILTTCYKDLGKQDFSTFFYCCLGLSAVPTHGDLWGNNIMWKKNPDGSLSNEVAAFIDFQMFHEGCITNDLARYLCVCLDGDVRRKHEFEILKFMYDKIVEQVGEKGKTVDFTFRQMKQGYKTNFIGHAIQLMLMVSFMYGGESRLQSWTDEEKKIKKAELEKLLIRTQFAVEDAIEYFKGVPKDRF
ncbi:hypothetical protein L596_023376 [Steinernema carpocapsae]|uniref:CHK kinase-like domain-containing protein n=1 Tax=Steinernema carpocapsae TaxID=34508 RepID=A0A4U5MDG4_STECR|nr:hypothetical protein L596_023376 [Steinernema carpocapsae]